MHDVAKTEKSIMIPISKDVKKAIIGVAVVVAGLILIKGLQILTMISGPQGEMPPTTVTSAEVKQEDWAPLLSAVGSISPVQGAMISSELPGTVAEVGFESGAMVKKGDLLVRLDTSAEEAQLHSADADTELARADVERGRDLAARKVISRAEIDAAESKFKQKSAVTDNMRAVIAKKTMRAPFGGAAGIRSVNVGQMVKDGQQIVPL